MLTLQHFAFQCQLISQLKKATSLKHSKEITTQLSSEVNSYYPAQMNAKILFTSSLCALYIASLIEHVTRLNDQPLCTLTFCIGVSICRLYTHYITGTRCWCFPLSCPQHSRVLSMLVCAVSLPSCRGSRELSHCSFSLASWANSLAFLLFSFFLRRSKSM